MKIVCSSCGAKYSIADEKVEGKVFKIRCKKCSNVIMVKGTEGEDVVSDAGSDAGAAEWYVVIDGEQVGPITSVEIDSYFMSGRIDRETYVWRDGLSDWQPMNEVAAFGHLTQDTAGPEEKTQISDGYTGDDFAGGMAGGAAASGFDDMQSAPGDSDATVSMTTSDSALDGGDDYGGGFSDFGGGDDAPQDDLAYAAAEESDAAAGGGFGGGFESFDSGGGAGGGLETSGGDSGGADHGGMFASFDAPDSGGSSGSGGGDDDFLGFSSGGSDAAPEPAPASNGSNGVNGGGAAANNMIGQRNENSVLFSLSSLDQVQAVSPEPAALGGGGAGPAAGGGDAAVTEGSGLIDIRSLASAHQSMKGQGGQDDSVDPFAGGTMAMPALMPMGSHRSNKGLIIAGVVGAVLFFGVAIAAIVVVWNSSNKEPQTKIVEKIIVQKEAASEESEKDSAKEAEEAKAAEQKALAAAEKEDGEKAEEEPKEEKSDKGSTARTARKKDRKETKKRDDPAPKPTRKAEKGDDIDKLLRGIDKKEESKPTPKPKPRESSAKSKLSKSDVSGTIRRYSGRIATCKRSQNKNNLDGTMWVKFAIKPNGRTSNASVATGKFNGTDVGNCVKKAVQGMRFPATSASSNVDIKYPFKL